MKRTDVVAGRQQVEVGVLAEVDDGLGAVLPPPRPQQELSRLPEVAGGGALLEGDAHPQHHVRLLHVLFKHLKHVVRGDALVCAGGGVSERVPEQSIEGIHPLGIDCQNP